MSDLVWSCRGGPSVPCDQQVNEIGENLAQNGDKMNSRKTIITNQKALCTQHIYTIIVMAEIQQTSTKYSNVLKPIYHVILEFFNSNCTPALPDVWLRTTGCWNGEGGEWKWGPTMPQK
jgi:hypothetical protein